MRLLSGSAASQKSAPWEPLMGCSAFDALFLKRCSDVFEERHHQIVASEQKKGRSLAEAKKRADNRNF